MTHPSIHARTNPNKIAYQMAGTGKAITYRELDELSNQGAHLFRSLGLKAGDHIALLMENRLAFMEICWAAQRSGLYYTAISRYLTQDEIDYIVKDCGAKVFITTPKCAEQVKGLVGQTGEPAVLHGGRARARLPLLRQGSGRAADHADRGRGRRLRHALFVRHHRPAQGHQEGIRGQPDRRAQRVPESSLRRHVRHERRQHLSVAGAALSRRSAALQHDGDHARRHLHHHGAFRRRGISEAGREVQGHAVAAGADHVRAHAEAAGGGAHALRRLVAERRDPCRRALPGRREGKDDRVVGADPDRVLRRLRRQRRHGLDLAAMADPSRHRRPRRGRQGQDPRRERRGAADRRDRHGLFRRRAGFHLSQRSREDEARLQRQGLVDARRRRLSRRRKAFSTSPTASPT